MALKAKRKATKKLNKERAKSFMLKTKVNKVDNDYIKEMNQFLQTQFRELKATMTGKSLNKKLKKLIISSTHTWDFIPEFVSDECGRTRYKVDDIVTVGVNLQLPFSLDKKGIDLVEVIKEQREAALAEVRKHRAQRQAIPFIEKEYSVPGLPVKPKYRVYAGGGYGTGNGNNFAMHHEPGTFLRLKEATKLKKIFETKTPKTNDHHVGIEIEFISKSDKAKVAECLLAENVQDFVHLKSDGSVQGEGEYKYSHELTMVAPEALIHVVLKKITTALDNAQSRVNKTCGLHVHLDMRNRDKKRSFNNLVKSQKILYAMNPAQRLTGEDANGNGAGESRYSKRIEVSNFDQAIGGDRYFGINATAYSKFKTIEVRIHSGSTNYDKISNWVKILCSIVNSEQVADSENFKASTFCERYGLDNDMLHYIEGRISKFKSATGKHITVEEVA